jgi:hypothetical protein
MCKFSFNFTEILHDFAGSNPADSFSYYSDYLAEQIKAQISVSKLLFLLINKLVAAVFRACKQDFQYMISTSNFKVLN